MKKRILIIALVIILMFVFGTINSFAAGNIELNVQGKTTVNSTDDTIELTLSLGSFTDIEEGQPLGFQGALEYDEDMFESIVVQGLNGWTVNYADGTFMGETDVANANTQIAKVTLTLKDAVEPGTSGKIQFNDILLTDGTNDFTFNKEITVTLQGEGEENNPTEDPATGGNNENTTEDDHKNTNSINKNVSTNTTTIQGSNTDKTTASTRLPSAGIKSVLIIAVVIAVISMIVFKIKSRDIKY